MTKPNSSGSVFPGNYKEIVDDPTPGSTLSEMKNSFYPGISLRQWLAGMVLQGMLSSPPIVDRAKVNKKKWVEIAYLWADAMIKQGEK